jgi:hypothetical protein
MNTMLRLNNTDDTGGCESAEVVLR